MVLNFDTYWRFYLAERMQGRTGFFTLDDDPATPHHERYLLPYLATGLFLRLSFNYW